MTEIQDWRGGLPHKHMHLPLPEPPRSHHEAKSVPRATDGVARALEDWLGTVAVATTIDAD